MKRILSLIIVFTILLGTFNTYAADSAFPKPSGLPLQEPPVKVQHNYVWDGIETDVCKDCGYLNVHTATHDMYFVTVRDHVVARKEPRASAKVTQTFVKKFTPLIVVGRIRNEKDNLWLKLSNGSFIFADRVAFDFDSTADEAYKKVSDNIFCEPIFHKTPLGGIGCAPGNYALMFRNFRPGGTYDLKISELLGLNTYDYQVFYDQKLLASTYSGEQLGNILYGTVCNLMGYSKEEAIKYAGLTNLSHPSEFVGCFFLGRLEDCDDEADIVDIQAGWDYANGKKRK